MKFLMPILQIMLLSYPLQASWIDRKAEGWAWYEDKIKPKQELEIKREETPKTAQEQLAEAKKQLEEKLAEAVIYPTEQNITNYMTEQKKWLQHSTAFAHIWEKVLLQSPELDPTATSYPITQYGIQLKKEIDNENKQLFIGDLSKTQGLFFFYEGGSKISQGFSKIVKRFSDKYNWDVIAISIDGITLEGFSSPKVDNGISKKMGISVFPALFIINPQDKTATPVAYGLVSLDKIEEKILLQFKPIESETVHE